MSTAIIATAGVQGSCTCRMSKRPYLTARSMRAAICGEKFTYASDPLLGTGSALPMGMKRSVTACRRLSTCRRAGVMAPTGAMIHGSWPRASSSAARCSTWWFTPPGTVQE